MYAASSKSMQAINLLVKSTKDLKATNNAGQTAYDIAVMYNRASAAKLLKDFKLYYYLFSQ